MKPGNVAVIVEPAPGILDRLKGPEKLPGICEEAEMVLEDVPGYLEGVIWVLEEIPGALEAFRNP